MHLIPETDVRFGVPPLGGIPGCSKTLPPKGGTPNLSRALAICFVVLLLLAGRAGAATLAEYRHRVSKAIALIEQLSTASGHDDQSLLENYAPSLARIREDLPATETVLVNAQSVVVDNSWLHQALQECEDTSNTRHQRMEALLRIE